MKNNFSHRQYHQGGYTYVQKPRFHIPTFKDFKNLFTKLDLFTLIVLVFWSFFNSSNPLIDVLIKSASVGTIFMPKFVLLMKKLQKSGQPIRDDGPQSHIVSKKGTPTMGGFFIVILSSILASIYCQTKMIYIPLLCLLFYGGLGFWDDFLKIKKNNSKGLKPRQKLFVQTAIGLVASFLIYSMNLDVTKVYFPFVGLVDLTVWIFLPLSTFVIVGASNAFNLTDGLDGLAITQFLVMAIFFIFAALGFTHQDFLTNYFYNVEVAKLVCILIGVSISFLLFNAFPAKIFMGDVGSLALGSLIGVVSVMFGLQIILVFSGIVLVIETISVIIQVFVYKKTDGKRRLFLMAPIHHHFEKLGIHENRIVSGAFIVAVIFNLIASQM
jgi:phospho-N-acetylmuramoyl-pentapeptide-transferase